MFFSGVITGLGLACFIAGMSAPSKNDHTTNN